MVAPLLVMGGVAAAQGLLGAFTQRQAAREQQTQQYYNEAEQWADNIADNKAIAESNIANQIRNRYRIGIANVQRGQAKKAAIQSGVDLSRGRAQAIGAATANAAATGSIGASVDAVLTDIDNSVQERRAALTEDFRVEQENFDTQMHDLLLQGEDALRSPVKARVQKTPGLGSPGYGAALLGAAINTAGQYAMAKMNLGLGKSTVPGK